jgi:integrase
MVKLTNKYVDSVKAPFDGPYERHWDDNVKGFGLRVTGKGVKSYFFEGRLGVSRRTKQIKIGRIDDISAEKARIIAANLSIRFRSGEYERDERENRNLQSVSSLISEYIDLHLRDKSSGHIDNVRRHLVSSFLPKFGREDIRSLRRISLVPYINKIKMDVSENASLAHFRSITAFLNWAVNTGYLESSPLAGVKPPATSRQRERVLTIEELKLIWKATSKLSVIWQSYFKLLILTGQRRSELAGMHANEIDGHWWIIPASRSKNRKPNKVYLTSLALSLLPNIDAYSGLYFTSNKNTRISGYSKILKKIRDEVNIPHWTLHDFRRSFSTHLHEMGQPPHIIEACLNHISGTKSGVSGIYNRAEYLDQRIEMFTQWSDVCEGF